jgi:hypothetical protein
MEKRKLNLDKIRLYCVLNRIDYWPDVPQCHNCKYKYPWKYFKEGCSSSSIPFSSDGKIREFAEGQMTLYYVYHGCDKWKRK